MVGCCGKPIAIALTTTVVLVVVGERALLLSGGVAAAWGLLTNIHAELLDVRKLVLHCNQVVGLALHCFLHGCKRGTEVHKRVIVRGDRSVIVHGGHSVTCCRAGIAV